VFVRASTNPGQAWLASVSGPLTMVNGATASYAYGNGVATWT
jgi:hypothetical protein